MGHMVNEDDVLGGNQVPGKTVMNQIHGANDSGNYIPTTIQSCDNNTVNNRVDYPPPDGGDSCQRQSCPSGFVWSADQCACESQNCGTQCNGGGSPILIDTDGSGFHLTDVPNGVLFNISGSGSVWMAWTAAGSTNAFLFLDRNGNSIVDDGTELFGNYTPQPLTSRPNAYNALAIYDLPENGGNSDGIIDQNDAVYSALRLWIDINHDGISRPEELFTLPELGVHKISLRYRFSYRRDRFGNQFRYRSRIDDDGARACYDVFFVTENSNTRSLLREPPIFDLLQPKSSCLGLGN